jgi:hypothetical protein
MNFDRQHVHRYLIPFLGRLRLDELSVHCVDTNWYVQRGVRGQGLEPRTRGLAWARRALPPLSALGAGAGTLACVGHGYPWGGARHRSRWASRFDLGQAIRKMSCVAYGFSGIVGSWTWTFPRSSAFGSIGWKRRRGRETIMRERCSCSLFAR